MGRNTKQSSGLAADPNLGMQSGIAIADALENHDPGKLLATLNHHGVEFIVIGGFAATIAGARRVTEDVDITPETSRENLERLRRALQALDAQALVDGADRGLPEIPIDVPMMNGLQNLSLVTRAGLLDVSFLPDGTKGYPDLREKAELREPLGVAVRVAALEDVIRSKEAAGRTKDEDALPELRALLGQMNQK